MEKYLQTRATAETNPKLQELPNLRHCLKQEEKPKCQADFCPNTDSKVGAALSLECVSGMPPDMTKPCQDRAWAAESKSSILNTPRGRYSKLLFPLHLYIQTASPPAFLQSEWH